MCIIILSLCAGGYVGGACNWTHEACGFMDMLTTHKHGEYHIYPYRIWILKDAIPSSVSSRVLIFNHLFRDAKIGWPLFDEQILTTVIAILVQTTKYNSINIIF